MITLNHGRGHSAVYNLWKRISNFFFLPTDAIHPEAYRSFVLFNFGSVAAFFIHLSLLPLFTYFAVYPMVWVNIPSLSAYLTALWCARRGRFRCTVVIAVFELVIHQALVAYYIGWEAGFQYYILSLTGVVFLLPNERGMMKVLLLGGAALGFVSIEHLFAARAPVYTLSTATLQAMHDINIVVVFFLLGIFSSYYGKAAVWAESKLSTRLNLALQSSNVGLWEWHIEDDEMFLSDEWKRQIGYEPDELPDRIDELESRLHPDDRDRVMGNLNACITKPESNYRDEFRLRHRNGGFLWILSQGSGRIGRDNKLVHLQGCHLDITARKKSEEALESLARFPAESPDPVMRFSYSGDNLYSNKASQATLVDDGGFYPQELLDLIRRSSSSESRLESEITVNGRTFVIRTVPFPASRYINMYATDISEKRKMEKRIMRQQKLESIGTLAGGIAHDFNNILSSIIGFADIALLDAKKDPQMADNLQEIMTAGLRAKDLVRQILSFARQTDEETHPVRVDLVAKEVVKFIRSSIPSTIEVSSDIRSTGLVMGNTSQLHQIFMNLLTNASQAMEETGGRLYIGVDDMHARTTDPVASPNLKPGRYIRITVADTGPGIPPDIMDAIFEPYFTTKEVGEGTGLGLAIVHGIVNSQGGSIHVSSRPGQTVFSLHLPVTSETMARKPVEEDLPLHGTERILVVDDETAIVKLNQQVLKNLGYRVTTSIGSLEALYLFNSKPNAFDLVITDMTMPNLTGDKLADEIAAIRPDIPIILCTGFSKKLPAQLKERNIKAVLIKPITNKYLAQNVRRILDEAAAGGGQMTT